MRRWGTVLPLLLCIGLTGCFTGADVRPTGWLERLYGPQTPLGPDAVLIDMMVIEQRLGDKFLNGEVWDATDCQVVGLEQQGLLADNGLRVGQVIGMVPGKLQNMLTSERYCVRKRRQIMAAGQTTVLDVGPALPVFNCRVRTDTGATDVILEQGQATLMIEPSLTNDGRTRLKFTPQVLYGTIMPDYRTAPDRSGWLLEFKRPSKTFPAASWEVTLAPNQCLIVGTSFDQASPDDEPQTLGSQYFLQETDQGWVQRLLVIRTTRDPSTLPNDCHAPHGGTADTSGAATQTTSPAAHCLMSK
jgi:hypothetical protein